MSDKIGVGILSYNRPDKLALLLESIKSNRLSGVEFYLFQDGPKNPQDQETVDACVWVFEQSGLGGEVHAREHNAYIATNAFEATEHLAANYARFVRFEDDAIISPYFFRLARLIWDWLEGQEKIASFCLGFKRRCALNEIGDNLDTITTDWAKWWGECMTADGWAKVRPYFLPYYEIVKNTDYREQRRAGGREWREFRARILDVYRAAGWPGNVLGQDGAMNMATYAAGMKRAVTVVNRCVSSGDIGEHFTPDKFNLEGYYGQLPYAFASDNTLRGFKWAA